MTDTDFGLISKIAKGNRESFREFVTAHQKTVLNLCYGFLRNKQDAEEIAQDVFIEIFRSAYKFRAESNVKTWLYRIAVNKSLNLIRKKKLSKWLPVYSNESLDEEKHSASEYDNPQQISEKDELRKQISKALNTLSMNQKIAFTMNKVDGLTNKEISEAMEISIQSVDVLIHRAKSNLRKKLYSYYNIK